MRTAVFIGACLLLLASGTRAGDIAAARELLTARKLPQAEAAFSALAAEDAPPLQRAQALTGLAMVAQLMGKGPTRREEIAQAVALLRAMPDQQLELARTLLQAAEIAGSEDDNERRLQLGEEAIALFEQQLGADRDLMYALIRVSNADGRLGRTAQGEDKVRRAAEIAERIGALPIDRIIILGRRAAFAYGRGALDEAEDLNRQALALALEHTPGRAEHANALRNLALIAGERGRLAEARQHMLAATEIRLTQGGGAPVLAAQLMSLAAIERSLGDHASARARLEDARVRLEALDSDSEIHVQVLLELAQVTLDEGDDAAAEALFERAQGIAGALPFECACKAGTLMSLAWFNQRAGRPARALALLRQARALHVESGSEAIRIAEAQAGEAEALLALDRIDEAAAALALAAPPLRAQAPGSIDDARLTWLEGRIARARGEAGDARRLFCEASRMLDRASLQGGDDVGQARFRARYAEVYRDCIEAGADAGDAAAVFDGLERLRLKRAQGRGDALQAPLALAEARARLPAGHVFLSWLTGDESTLLLAFGRDGEVLLRRLPVSADALAAEVAGLRARILAQAADDDAALLRHARRLQRWLLAPARPLLADARGLVLAPDGPLHDLPWAALHDGRRFLVERHALLVADTLTPPPAVAAVASPQGVLGVADPGPGAAQGLLRGRTLAALPHAREEVAGLAAQVDDATVLVGDDASEAAVRTHLAAAGWIHFAVHAELNAHAPLQSALLLRPGAGGRSDDDGLLQAVEIAQLQLPARMVVLSGCDTGRGGRLDGVALIGLVRAFQSAGAERVLASLWPIADRGTAALFARYYADGPPADGIAAWREAVVATRTQPQWLAGGAQRGVGGLAPRAQDSGRWLPYHWAGLQVYGRP